MTILNFYYTQKERNIFPNQAQMDVLRKLENIQNDLILERKKRLQFRILRKNKLVNGMYLYGGVGIGKTFLMDCFFHSLPIKSKMRMHFFQFMQFIHFELKKYEGKKNPLTIIAKKLAEDTMVICLDEFFVKDIVDAMLLAHLLKALFNEGITLITTSNIPPDELYKRGLQRDQFLPAIDLVKAQTEVVYLSSTIDYRLRSIQSSDIYFCPHDSIVEDKMGELFHRLSSEPENPHLLIEIAGRNIKTIMNSRNCVWFDFQQICTVPRSQMDYLAIAAKYQIVMVSNIPAIEAHEKNIIRLFISMIDVFYDAHTKFIFSTAVPLADIYVSGDMIFEFARTESRLREMQTESYFQFNPDELKSASF